MHLWKLVGSLDCLIRGFVRVTGQSVAHRISRPGKAKGRQNLRFGNPSAFLPLLLET